jgi:hypothetical protein
VVCTTYTGLTNQAEPPELQQVLAMLGTYLPMVPKPAWNQE